MLFSVDLWTFKPARCGPLLYTHELVGLNFSPSLLGYSVTFLGMALFMSSYLPGPKSIAR